MGFWLKERLAVYGSWFYFMVVEVDKVDVLAGGIVTSCDVAPGEEPSPLLDQILNFSFTETSQDVFRPFVHYLMATKEPLGRYVTDVLEKNRPRTLSMLSASMVEKSKEDLAKRNAENGSASGSA